MKRTSGFLLLLLLMTACAGQTSLLPTATTVPTAAATVDPYVKSDGGGDPRTVGYWLLWNSCAAENRADVAASNGGREAGWVLLDDLLLDPGIQVGNLVLESCPQALNLLELRSLSGEDRSEDPLYALAAQQLAAQLNLAVGSEVCHGLVDAVLGSQKLLVELGFDGEQGGITTDSQEEFRGDALLYLEALQQYNQGSLCK